MNQEHYSKQEPIEDKISITIEKQITEKIKSDPILTNIIFLSYKLCSKTNYLECLHPT